MILENRFVRLEPMSPAHKEDLRAACAADPETWRRLYVFSMLGDAFEASWERMFGANAPGWLGHAVVVDGRCMGMTSYLAIDPANRSLEIGGTYYHPDLRGGAVNPACKRLLMANAFEAGARRVQYKVDAINARSRAAVLKLGAVQEGIIRSERTTWTGRLRDSVVFSVLEGEWPDIRDRLDARLAAFG
jgi:RimJ/RimL family protein N-acetyltransferase